MKTIFFDIETKPNPKLVDIFYSKIKAPKTYKDPEKIEAYIEEKKADVIKQMSVDVDFCQIKCIGVKIDDEPAQIVSLEKFIEIIGEQLKVKSEMASEFASRHFFRLVSFNGKRFDLPIIIRECIRTGIQSTSYLGHLKSWCKRFDNSTHLDLYEFIGEGEGKSLDMYSQIYLEWPKKELDFADCTQQELEEHCKDDVEMTAALYHKFENLAESYPDRKNSFNNEVRGGMDGIGFPPKEITILN